MKTINIGLVGHKFMGRAHTHAITDAPIFFDPGLNIVKKTICSNEESVFDVAKRWGWEKAALDWRELIEDDDIDAISIAAPSKVHAEIAIAAAQAGKHVFCEKPLALDMKDAEAMVEAVNKAGVVNMVGFNFRRVPALCLAKQLIEDGTLGEIYHFRAIWQQDWLTDPMFPMSWRLRRNMAGYGTHGDLGAHLVDIARFLVGEIDVIRELRRESDVPVLMLTARSDTLDKIVGLELGADDYILKPFEPKELLARVKAVLRRTRSASSGVKEGEDVKDNVVSYPGLVVDRIRYTVRVGDEEIDMPPKELELLFFLATHPNRVFTRDQILESIWGMDYYGEQRTVDVHIKRIREKLDVIDHPLWQIKTVWSVGYKFEVKDDEI
jgi:DNA-binding response OmpR family regulator